MTTLTLNFTSLGLIAKSGMEEQIQYSSVSIKSIVQHPLSPQSDPSRVVTDRGNGVDIVGHGDHSFLTPGELDPAHTHTHTHTHTYSFAYLRESHCHRYGLNELAVFA
jgi:hypothetical protein